MADMARAEGGAFDDFISAFDAGFKKLTAGGAHEGGRELAVETPAPLAGAPVDAPAPIYVRYGYVAPESGGPMTTYTPQNDLAPVPFAEEALATPPNSTNRPGFSPPTDGSTMTRHGVNVQEGVLYALNNRALSMSGRKALSRAQKQFIERYAAELDGYLHKRMGTEAGAMLSRFRSQLEHEQYRLDAQLRQERQDLRDATLERIARSHDRNSRKFNDPDIRAAYEEMKRQRIQHIVAEDMRDDPKGR